MNDAKITRLLENTTVCGAEIYYYAYVMVKRADYNEDLDLETIDVESIKNKVVDLIPYELEEGDKVDVYFDEDGDSVDLLIDITLKLGKTTWGQVQEIEDNLRDALGSMEIAEACDMPETDVVVGSIEEKLGNCYNEIEDTANGAVGEANAAKAEVKDAPEILENIAKTIKDLEVGESYTIDLEETMSKALKAEAVDEFDEELEFEAGSDEYESEVDGGYMEHYEGFYHPTKTAELPCECTITKTEENKFEAKVDIAEYKLNLKLNESLYNGGNFKAQDIEIDEDLKDAGTEDYTIGEGDTRFFHDIEGFLDYLFDYNEWC